MNIKQANYSNMRHLLLFILAATFCLSSGPQAIAQKKNGKKRDEQPAAPESHQTATAASAKETPAVSDTDLQYAFIEGMKFYLIEDYRTAYEVFSAIAEQAKQLPDIQLMMGKCAFMLKDYAVAEQHAGEAVKLGKANEAYQLLLAQIYQESGQFEKAYKAYVALLQINPRNEDYYFDMAQNALNTNNLNAAIEAYNSYEKAFGLNPSVVQQKQVLYVNLHNLDKAIEEGQKLIRYFPHDVQFVLMQVQLLVNNRRTAEAEKLMQETAVHFPGHPLVALISAELALQKADWPAFFSHARTAMTSPELEAENKYSLLLNMYERYYDKADKHTEQLVLTQIAHELHPSDLKIAAIHGNLLTLTNQLSAARLVFKQSLSYDGDNFQVWQQLLNADWQLGLYDSLAKDAQTAIEFFPNQALLYLHYGSGLHLTGQYQEALAILEQGLRMAGNNKELQMQFQAQLGDTYFQLSQYAKSDAAYEAALKYDRNNTMVLNNYSYYLSLRKEKLDLAKTLAGRLVELAPNEATYLDTYGWVLYVSGDYPNAKIYLERAANQSQDATIVEHYGDVLFRLGNTEAAVQQWQKAKLLGTDKPDMLEKKIAQRSIIE